MKKLQFEFFCVFMSWNIHKKSLFMLQQYNMILSQSRDPLPSNDNSDVKYYIQVESARFTF